MRSETRFLLAARQCEIAELEQLARTCELVGVFSRFTHVLQRERGLSNVYLASGGRHLAAALREQVAACEQLEREVRASLDALDLAPGHARNGSRLFSRIAVVLWGLDGLPALRARVAALQVSPAESTATFIKLVSGLLAVVFEAADSATDPQISKALVALFNFMQGKEFAGQERAHGAARFASGRIDAAVTAHWRHLVESQQGCLVVFRAFADPAVVAADRAAEDPRVLAEIERLRAVGGDVEGTRTPDPALSHTWFEWCTRRIDGMKTVEDLLALHLRSLCEQRIAQARAELRDQEALLQSLATEALSASPATRPPIGQQLERSILGMVQEQATRLQAMGDELDTVRASLNERKLVERAKGLLMAHRQMSEPEAYKALRQLAMNQNRRLADVAEAVLAMSDVLPVR